MMLHLASINKEFLLTEQWARSCRLVEDTNCDSEALSGFDDHKPTVELHRNPCTCGCCRSLDTAVVYPEMASL